MQLLTLNRNEHIQSFWNNGLFYEQDMLLYIRSLNLDGLYVDVGSCIGNHTLFFAGIMNKTVASFEPNQLSLALQIHNLLVNQLLEKVTYYNVALSDKSGRTNIIFNNDNWGMSRLTTGNKIDVKRLDDYEFANVAVIKIDVEGMEDKVLEGALWTLVNSRPTLFVETSEPESLMKYLPQNYSIGKQFNATPTFEFYPKERNDRR